MSDFFARLAGDVLMWPSPVYQGIRPRVPTLFSPGLDVPPGEIPPESPPVPTSDTMPAVTNAAVSVDLPESASLSPPPSPPPTPLVPRDVPADRTVPLLQTLLNSPHTEAVVPPTAEPAAETPDAAAETVRAPLDTSRSGPPHSDLPAPVPDPAPQRLEQPADVAVEQETATPSAPPAATPLQRPALAQREITQQTVAPSPTMPLSDPVPPHPQQPVASAEEAETLAPITPGVAIPSQPASATAEQREGAAQTVAPSPTAPIPSLPAQPVVSTETDEVSNQEDGSRLRSTAHPTRRAQDASLPRAPQTPAVAQSATPGSEDTLLTPVRTQSAAPKPDRLADRPSSQPPGAKPPSVATVIRRELDTTASPPGAPQDDTAPRGSPSRPAMATISSSPPSIDSPDMVAARAPATRRTLPPETPPTPGEQRGEQHPPPAAADRTAQRSVQTLSPGHPSPEPVAPPAPTPAAMRRAVSSTQPMQQREAVSTPLQAEETAQAASPLEARSELPEAAVPLASRPAPAAIRPRLPQTLRNEPTDGPATVERRPAPAAAPIVTISIGRVVVKSAPPPSAPAPASPPPSRRQPAVSLQDYLARHGRSR